MVTPAAETRRVLAARLEAVQAEAAQKRQLREVVTAQLNLLIGREAELTELLALLVDEAAA